MSQAAHTTAASVTQRGSYYLQHAQRAPAGPSPCLLPRHGEVPAVGVGGLAYADGSCLGAHVASWDLPEFVAAPHVEEVAGSAGCADTFITGITTLSTITLAYAINGVLTIICTLRAVISHLPARTDHDRPTGPRGAPAGRWVLAGLGAGDTVCRTRLLIVRPAVSALECRII